MIKNIIQTIFNKGFVAVVNFLILIVSTRYLGVSTRGEIAIFILNIANIQIINEIFTGFSQVYFVPKFNTKKLYTYGVIWTLIAVPASNLILFLLGKEIAGFELDMLFLSAMIILNTFNLVIILGKENIKLFNLLSMLQPFLLLCGIAFFVLVLKDGTFRSYVIPLYISFAVSFIVSTITVFKYISKPDQKSDFSLKSIFSNGFFCQAAVLLHLQANRYSFYILSSVALVGLYSIASSLMESVWIIANGIAPVVLSKIANTGDTPFSKNITVTLAKISLALSTLAAIVVYFLPNELFVALLGEDFSNVRGIMLWIAPGILFISFSTILSHYFSGLGNLKFIALCNFLGFLCTIILAPILISKYNIKGAAITANVSYLVSSLALFIGFMIKTKIGFGSLFSFKTDVQTIKQAFSGH
jgi:O-antigen/teichoic acid export membrane protein